MIDKNWQVMNDLQEAFNQITSIDFLLERLQEAVDAQDQQAIVDITLALNAFIPPYTKNWDKKFSDAWDQVIKPVDTTLHIDL